MCFVLLLSTFKANDLLESQWLRVSAALGHTLAIKAAGTLWGWGQTMIDN
jgi:hypothetical protein